MPWSGQGCGSSGSESQFLLCVMKSVVGYDYRYVNESSNLLCKRFREQEESGDRAGMLCMIQHLCKPGIVPERYKTVIGY